MLIRLAYFILFSLLAIGQLFAINGIDSLRNQYLTADDDLLKIDALDKLTNEYSAHNYDSAIYFSDIGIGLAVKANYKKGLASIMLNRGNTHMYFSELDESLNWYKRSAEIAQENNLKELLSKGWNNIGIIYDTQSNNNKALQYYQRSLQLKIELGNIRSLKSTYLNIGGVYVTLGDYETALKFFSESEKIGRSTRDSSSTAHVLINKSIVLIKLNRHSEAIPLLIESIKLCTQLQLHKQLGYSFNTMAVAYFNMEEHDSAKHYYDLSLIEATRIDDSVTISKVMTNLADIHIEEGNLDEAKSMATEALRIKMKTKDTRGQSLSRTQLANISIEQGDYATAKSHLDIAFLLVKEGEYIDELTKVYNTYRSYYLALKDYKNAYAYYELYEKLEDSIRGKETIQKIHALELKNEREKQETKINLLEKDKELAKIKLDKSNLLNYSFATGGILVFILGLVALRAYVRKKKDHEVIHQQKLQVEDQKIALEIKNKSITDSIRYAKRIQNAIIPPISIVKEYLGDIFILYKPKDIVAGDFYWLEKRQISGRELILFAVADCTGHGVPGALLSVVCHNALNRAVKEFNVTKPGSILDKVSELVNETFEKSEQDVHDGMDIALCLVDKQKSELHYAGAHNPLYQIRKGELNEFKGSREPIPKFRKDKAFSNEIIQMQKDDMYYIFSDGFADQFGGSHGRKLKYKPFQELLLNNSTLSMEEQHDKLEVFFEKWRGSEEQVDDVCLMGFKI
ncbi:MAG: hypothetical protein COB85_09075 [Bacteroidetes bacterium]|nr:MAG: hypothetical protein COB85_09075 [Bacteroidota bacterium]